MVFGKLFKYSEKQAARRVNIGIFIILSLAKNTKKCKKNLLWILAWPTKLTRPDILPFEGKN